MEENLKDQEQPKEQEEKQESTKPEPEEQATEQENSAESTEGLPSMEEAMKILAETQAKLRETERALEEQKNQAMRLQADFINFRKRKEKEMADTIRFANEGVLKELLPVLDNFDRTLDAIEKTDNLTAVKDGIKLVSNSMKKQLKKIGLEPIDSKGKKFDVDLHEAITSIPVEKEKQKGQVIDVIEKGYKLKDKVIRFSKVVIGE
ncbi:MAG: nucleotide exchange factor GrpE [Bacteroidota bacterium]